VGGRRYGAGRKGTVYNLACTDDKSSCHDIVANPDHKLIIYTYDNKRIQLSKSDIPGFIESLAAQTDLVAKRFADKGPFLNEINGVHSLKEIFGPEGLFTYTTYQYFDYGKLKIIGFEYGKYYYIINEKCSFTVFDKVHKLTRPQIDELIQDVLEIMSKYVAKDYFHGDVKLDNMMFCGKRFKMIDYEFGRVFKTLKPKLLTRKARLFKHPYGSIFITHPMVQYLYYNKIPVFISSGAGLYTYVFLRHSYGLSLSQFNKLRRIIQEELISPVTKLFNETKLSKSQLFEKYKRSFDISTFGISVLILYVTRNLPQKYLEFAKTLINPLNPDFAETPEAALANFRRLI
jgi:serine/threonine protein kinase